MSNGDDYKLVLSSIQEDKFEAATKELADLLGVDASGAQMIAKAAPIILLDGLTTQEAAVAGKNTVSLRQSGAEVQIAKGSVGRLRKATWPEASYTKIFERITNVGGPDPESGPLFATPAQASFSAGTDEPATVEVPTVDYSSDDRPDADKQEGAPVSYTCPVTGIEYEIRIVSIPDHLKAALEQPPMEDERPALVAEGEAYDSEVVPAIPSTPPPAILTAMPPAPPPPQGGQIPETPSAPVVPEPPSAPAVPAAPGPALGPTPVAVQPVTPVPAPPIPASPVPATPAAELPSMPAAPPLPPPVVFESPATATPPPPPAPAPAIPAAPVLATPVPEPPSTPPPPPPPAVASAIPIPAIPVQETPPPPAPAIPVSAPPRPAPVAAPPKPTPTPVVPAAVPSAPAPPSSSSGRFMVRIDCLVFDNSQKDQAADFVAQVQGISKDDAFEEMRKVGKRRLILAKGLEESIANGYANQLNGIKPRSADVTKQRIG